MTLAGRHKTVFLLAMKYRPDTAEDLFRFLPLEDAKALTDIKQGLAGKNSADVRAVIETELLIAARLGATTYLSEVHNDWILEELLGEPPAVIAVALRSLPPERVRFLLENLPDDVLARLPRLSDSFGAKREVVDLLQSRFESRFTLTATMAPGDALKFEHLALLRSVLLRKVFQELGYREIALGLTGLPESTRVLVLGRLLPTDRLRVEYHLVRHVAVDAVRIKKAQVHLISKNVDTGHPDLFARELGFLIYAKALLPGETGEKMRMIRLKMPKREAVALDEAMEQYARANTEAGVLPYREGVLAALRTVMG